MIGLYDCDLIECREFVPNPEIMLLSSYYKSKGEIVHLLQDFSNIDLYKAVYIRKNKKSKTTTVTPEIYTRNNVEFGGLFFTNGVYSPLPEEIIAAAPDITIYDKYIRSHPEIKANNMNAQYLSIRKGENVVDKRKVFIIDPDITDADIELLNSVQRKTPQQVFHFYYRPKLETLEGAKIFLNSPWLPKSEKCRLDWEVSITDLVQLKPTFQNGKDVTTETYLTYKTRFADQGVIDRIIVDTLNKYFYAVNNNMKFHFIMNPYIRKGAYPILERLAAWTHTYNRPCFYDYIKNSTAVRTQCDEIMKKRRNTRILFLTNPYDFTKQGGIWNHGTV